MASHPDVAGPTHEVFNQPPKLPRYNAYQQDQSLQQALHRKGATWAETMVNDYGALMGGELR